MNPFVLTTYEGPAHFCDREAETKTIISNISNKANTTCFAQRRLGKTALIHHVFGQLKKNSHHCIYIDIYATQDLKDLSNAIANGIYRLFPEKHSIGRKFWEAIKLLRPVLTVDELSGTPELSLDITQPRQFEKTVPQLLQFLDQQNKKVVVAIDEFQQILNYPEKNVEAILRTAIQQLKNVQFIFCGSNHKMMHQIFNSAKRPFYASTRNIHLKKIEADIYRKFIVSQFRKHRFKITDEAADLILDLTAGHTYYTQRLCHDLFAGADKTIGPETVSRTMNTILTENEHVYFQYRNLVTAKQWLLLKAIAAEEKLQRPYAQDFIYKYKLGTAANVKRGLESLLEKELVYNDASAPGTYIEVEDKFFMRWLKHRS